MKKSLTEVQTKAGEPSVHNALASAIPRKGVRLVDLWDPYQPYDSMNSMILAVPVQKTIIDPEVKGGSF